MRKRYTRDIFVYLHNFGNSHHMKVSLGFCRPLINQLSSCTCKVYDISKIQGELKRSLGITIDIMGSQEILWDLKKVRGISRYFKGSQNISWDLKRAHEISISNHDIGGNEDIFDIVDIVDTDMRFFKKKL